MDPDDPGYSAAVTCITCHLALGGASHLGEGESDGEQARERPGLVATLATGVKDIPRNASWLLGKAMPSGDDSNGANHGETTHGVVDSMKQVGSTLKGALPGQDSVEARLARARAAADRANEEEQAAIEAAQRAHDLAAEADDVNTREHSRLKEVKDEQARLLKERVAEAQLLRLASARGVANSSSKTKQQLVTALHRAEA